MEERKTTIIALVGKGGVGKTSISAITVRLLKEKYPTKRILAIDADPAIGLATALGVEVGATVDDIRKLFIQNVEEGNQQAAIEILAEAKYRMVDALVQEIVRTHSFDNWTVLKEHLKIVSEAIRNEFSNTSKSLKK